jgi:serine/threonine-protein kinase
MPYSNYRILGQIGQGQFGQVFCAVHRQTGELVALKYLDGKRFPTRLFLRELSCLASLRHPNIVAWKAIEHNRTGRYLAMDYCQGGTLRDVIEFGNLSLVQRLKLIADVLSGLEHAHQRDIVHCDIKPENILLNLTPTGWMARLSDFGIARISQETSNANQGRGYTGSPAYMAPERFYGKSLSASDLYAVGVMLFELVVGKRPFSGIPSELMSAHLTQPVVLPETVPFILRSTIATALEKLPQRRFAGAGEMLKSVRLAADVLAAEPSSSRFFSVSARPLTSSAIGILHQERLPAPVTHLAVEAGQVYLGMGDRLCCKTYGGNLLTDHRVEQWQVQFSDPLVGLSLSPQGCLAITQSRSPSPCNYSLYYLPKTEVAPKSPDKLTSFSLSAQTLLSGMAPQGQWLALCSSDRAPELTPTPASLQILQLPTLKPLHVLVNCPLPSQLIALDGRYGLAIFPGGQARDRNSHRTVFRLFHRRGRWVGSFAIPIALQRVTPSLTSPYRLLAVEQDNPTSVVFIDLKPLKVTRIALAIAPTFIVPRQDGYFLADLQGRVIWLNPTGFLLTEFTLPFPPKAITALSESNLLVATQSGGQGKLYSLGLTHSPPVPADDELDSLHLPICPHSPLSRQE